MPELVEEGDHGDLADLLAENGYTLDNPNTERLAKLPLAVKRRVRALKANQLKYIDLEAKFFERVHQLEKEFETEFSKLSEERRLVVSGEREPSEDECTQPLVSFFPPEKLEEFDQSSEPDKGEKGIPEFWLHVLKGSDHISTMIEPHDEPVLAYLTDITASVEEKPMGYSLYFHFAENPYFTNRVICKSYVLQCEPNPEEPFDYDGPFVKSCKSDKIEWKSGKDITKKVVKKKQKKGANAGKFLTKTVKADSFFNFFDPPQIDLDKKNEDDEDYNEEDEALLVADYEAGQALRDTVINHAVLFFTGEAAEFDDLEDDDDEEDEELSDEDDEE